MRLRGWRGGGGTIEAGAGGCSSCCCGGGGCPCCSCIGGSRRAAMVFEMCFFFRSKRESITCGEFFFLARSLASPSSPLASSSMPPLAHAQATGRCPRHVGNAPSSTSPRARGPASGTHLPSTLVVRRRRQTSTLLLRPPSTAVASTSAPASDAPGSTRKERREKK